MKTDSFWRMLPLCACLAWLLSCSSDEEDAAADTNDTDSTMLAARYVQAVANGTLSEAERDATLDKGRRAAAALVQSLLTAQLKSAMEAGGPEHAIQVCQQVAQPMTDSTGNAFVGVSIRRTSLKVRNSANAPDGIDREILEAWQAARDVGQKLPREDIVRDGDVARYYKPIGVKALCLNCHGERSTLMPEVVAMLEQFYPEDQALGYQEGDFRGVVRVDVTLSP